MVLTITIYATIYKLMNLLLQVFLFIFSGEKCDPSELGRLLQLILGCAVNCSQKESEFCKI